MSRVFEALHKGGHEAHRLLPPLTPGLPTEPVADPAGQEALLFEAPVRREGYRTLPLDLGSSRVVLPFEYAGEPGEQYRVLRTKILQHAAQPRMILVSSAGPSDGKTITSVNLAGALALKNDASILLIDADFRRPTVARQLGLTEGPGLANVLAGDARLEDAIIRTEQYPNLCVLPAGASDRNPTELLDSSRWHDIAANLRASFRYVIVDSPPMGSVADYDLLLAAVDGVIVVVRPDQTNRMALSNALSSLTPDRCLGVVLNCVPRWFLSRHFGYFSASDYYRSQVR
jgi:capsular exopolysaccharide synthesis family protein